MCTWGVGWAQRTYLLQDHNLVGCLQVLQLVGDQDARLVLQQTTDTPDTRHTGVSTYSTLCVRFSKPVFLSVYLS